MGKNVVLYNIERLFIGPAPASGFHFMSYSGGHLNDGYVDDTPNFNTSQSTRGEGWINSYFTTYQPTQPNALSGPVIVDPNRHNLIRNKNLLFPIDRVQSIKYSIDVPRYDLMHLGKRGYVSRPIINSPVVNLSFDYLMMGLKNEARMGFFVNYPRFECPYSGDAFYSSRVCPISGFIDKRLSRSTGEYNWPYKYRDKRNLFLVINNDSEDVHKANREDFTEPDIYQYLDPKNSRYNVISFGNCYLNSYAMNLAIGAPPIASVSYVCENIQSHSSGSGVLTPAIDSQTRSGFNKHFVIPGYMDEGSPSVLKPGDVVLTLSGIKNPIDNLIFSIGDMRFQSFSFELPLNRELLNNLGHFLPVDRVLNFPLIGNITFNALINENQTGNLVNIINQDEEYDISLKMIDKKCSQATKTDPQQPDIPTGLNNTVIQYDFYKTKFIDSSYSSQIGDFKSMQMSFQVEIDPDDNSRGWFASGLLEIEKLENFVLLSYSGNVASGDKSYLLNTDNTVLVNDLNVLY